MGIGARVLNWSQPGWGLSPDKLGQYQGPSYSPSEWGGRGSNWISKKYRAKNRNREGRLIGKTERDRKKARERFCGFSATKWDGGGWLEGDCWESKQTGAQAQRQGQAWAGAAEIGARTTGQRRQGGMEGGGLAELGPRLGPQPGASALDLVSCSPGQQLEGHTERNGGGSRGRGFGGEFYHVY